MTTQEDKDQKLRHLRWKCRRGMLELDQLLNVFLETKYMDLPVNQQQLFVELLEHNDQQLWNWFIIGEQPEDSHLTLLIKTIREGAWNSKPPKFLDD